MKIDLRKPSGNRFERDLRAILVETMMGGGMSLSKIKIKGSKEQMIRFASVLAAEKEYLEAVEQQGEDSIMATKMKAKLKGKINDFERVLEAKWPLV
jgi:hypothetical protein